MRPIRFAAFLALCATAACAPAVSEPPDPKVSPQFSEMFERGPNSAPLYADINSCVKGEDGQTGQKLRICEFCALHAEVDLRNGTTDVVVRRRRGTVQYRLAAAEGQPAAMPVKGAKGVWAIDGSTLRYKTTADTMTGDFAAASGYRRLSGLEAMMSSTPGGDYYMPPNVRERILSWRMATAMINEAGGCPPES